MIKPIVILGYILRSAMMSVRRRLLQAGGAGKVALGSAMLLIAIATISGRDRQAEAWLVNHFPAWLRNLTTRFLHHGPGFPVFTPLFCNLPRSSSGAICGSGWVC